MSTLHRNRGALVFPVALDHLVVGAASLDQGIAWIRDMLGVEIPRGGEHVRMGTHNCLMQIGSGAYLEVIAINPAAPFSDRPRWFGLDNPTVRAALEQEPSLLTWVVNTCDISASLQQTEFSFGNVEAMSRNDLKWLITIPTDGNPPEGGVIPMLIQWQNCIHPADSMTESGCSLEKLEIYHAQPEAIAAVLKTIGAWGLVEIQALPAGSRPYLAARILTPSGSRVLTGRMDR